MESYTNLEMVRQRCAKTQEEVAKFLGISRNTLIAYEKGKSDVPVTVFIRLAKYYHCDVYEIYGVHTNTLIYDVPIEELHKAHAEYQIEQKRLMNEINGIDLPDEYYIEEYNKLLNTLL